MMGQSPLERPIGIYTTEIEGDMHKTHLNTSFRCRIAQQSDFGDGRFQRGVGLVCTGSMEDGSGEMADAKGKNRGGHFKCGP